MAFRLLFWRRPRPAVAGRHTRATALPVPDSTGLLATGDATTGLDSAVPVPIVVPVPAPTAGHLPTQDQVPAPVEAPAEPPAAEVAEGPVDEGPRSPDTGAGVALGFSDGASVELHPDDPRVTSFRAAAAALLDPHRV
jgi:hypothetical protein